MDKCHGPLDGSQDYIMIIGEFSTSSKDDSAAHILRITKLEVKNMKISEKIIHGMGQADW